MLYRVKQFFWAIKSLSEDIDKDYVRVIVSMFGKETPVELDLGQVEPVTED